MKHPQALYGEADLKLGWLSVWALSREFPNAEDDSDGDWINIHAHVEAPGARIDVQGPWLRSEEVAGFRDELLALNHELKGAAELACLEPYLSAKITSAALGHMIVVIEVTPEPMSQVHRFTLELDQSYLAPLITQCGQILERFPLKGRG